MGRFPGVSAAVGGTVVLAAVSTFGDWLWANYLTDGAILPGVLHGLVFFVVLAAVLAAATGSRPAAKRLFWSLPPSGLLLAAAFYPVAMLTRNYLVSLMVTWFGMWAITAFLQRWARGNVETRGRTVQRAVAAAIFSGLAFWAISGIWTQPSPDGPNYPWHFLCWGFAFLPGLLALLVGQPEAD